MLVDFAFMKGKTCFNVFKNMEHFLKENAAIALQILFTVLLLQNNYKHEGCEEKSRTTNTRSIWIYEESNS